MERITGPLRGFYIATYACEAGGPEVTWLAYSKLCRTRPESYWDAQGIAKVTSSRSHPTAEAALADAERQARSHALNYAPVDYARTLFAPAVR